MRTPYVLLLAFSIAVISIVLFLLPGIIGGIVSAVIVSRALNSQTQELERLIEIQKMRTAPLDSSPQNPSDRPSADEFELETATEEGAAEPGEAISSDVVISTPRAIATVDILAKVTGTPVAMAFASDGRIFYTELKTGEIRVLNQEGVPQGTFATLPVMPDGDEQGLLGLALDPNFESNGFLYAYYSYQFGGESFNRVVRLEERPGSDPDVTTILDEIPGASLHNGGSILVDEDRKMYISVGEAGTAPDSQRRDNLKGKILRINLDGTVPEDNPIPGSPVYAIGFRNPFGLALDTNSDTLYAIDNGPECCDEVNIVKENGNFGWPLARGIETGTEFDNPIYVWEPRTVAPTIPAFYHGTDYGTDFQNSLIVGTFNTAELFLFDQEFLSDPESNDPQLLTRLTNPIIGVFESPDGELFLTARGAIYRVSSLDRALVASIDFREGHNSEHLLYGWYDHELGGRARAFRWTSSTSESQLPPISTIGDGWLRIVGGVRLDVHEGDSIKLEAILNNVSLGDVEIDDEGEFRVSFPVDGDNLMENAAASVILEVSPTFVPAETIPDSTDMRELGVKVNSISLVIP